MLYMISYSVLFGSTVMFAAVFMMFIVFHDVVSESHNSVLECLV